VVRTSDLQPIGRRFVSRPLHFTNDAGQVVNTHVPLFTKQYKLLVPAKGRLCSMAGKVTVGLVSHWPCVTRLSGIPIYGLNGLRKEDGMVWYGIVGFNVPIDTL